jgi:type I restriction enzyme, S subunit
MKFTPDLKKTDPLFLYYWFSSPWGQDDILSVGIGSSVPGFNLGQLRHMKVRLPSMAEQHTIVSILGNLDDKIELNRRMNETLEKMARAIFKDWFVDFGPTRAKAEGCVPYLAPEFWSLFPSCLDGEDKPMGWVWQNLGHVVYGIKRGLSPSYTEDGGVLVLNQKCVRDRRIDAAKGRRHDLSKKSIAGRTLATGDILINSTGVGTLGRIAQVWHLPEADTVVDSHVTVVRPDNVLTSSLYLGFNLISREAEIEALGEGSTGQTELSRVRLGELPILVPDQRVQAVFEQITYSLVERIVLNDIESRTLAQTRDYLLPKLMSGEIRIREAEKLVAAAL